MKNNYQKKKIPGLIMTIIGFIFILISALNDFFHWKMGSPLAALGIIFVAVGVGLVRRANNSNIRDSE